MTTAPLARPHLTVMTRIVDAELARIQNMLEHVVLVDGRGDLERELCNLLVGAPADPTAKTLDLVGHSCAGTNQLLLGDWLIDGSHRAVKAFFRGLADNEVLPRLGVYAVRLLGCQTADTEAARATICRIADILGVEVYGTHRQLLYSGHYNEAGFRDDCAHMLIGANDLRHEVAESTVTRPTEPFRRVLDIDALPTTPLGPGASRRFATSYAAREILQLIRRDDGAQMPGLQAAPRYDLALPSTKPGWYHQLQVLLDGEFVRVYPDGEASPGVVFPVDDPVLLRVLVEALPNRPVSR
jgi:hypothetical protein